MTSKQQPNQLNVRTLAKENFAELWSRAAKIGVPIAAVGGFVADVLAPLGPFVTILAGLTGALCIVSGIIWFGFKRRQIRQALADGKIDGGEFQRIGAVNGWSVAFAFNLCASLVLMLFFGAQKVFATENPDRGAIASAMPEMAALQAQLLGLQEKTDRIDATTQRLETKADEMRTALAALDEKVAQINTADSSSTEPQKPADCAANKALAPYGKVYEAGDLKVEMGTFNAKNKNGMQDVVLRISGGAAYDAGIDGQAIHYFTKPGFEGSGVFFTYKDGGAEPVRMLIRPHPDGEIVRVFLKNEQSYDLKLNAGKSKALCTSQLEI